LRATARRDGDHYVLDGTKAWITSGGRAGLYLVMARTSPDGGSRGISAFIVEAGTPGLCATKPEDKLGMRASVTTQIVLDGCRVPSANLLGAEGDGFKVAMGSLDGGRIGVAAQACGIAAAAQRCALDFARGGRADGAALSEQQSTQWLIADNAAELDAGWLLVLRAAALKDKGAPHSREAAMAKVFCTEMASEVASRALQVLGEAGEDSRHSAERNLRDARVTRIYEGTSEVQRIVIARECLKALS
jgi:alkylation response protein AidB-like acyl-CoA dehydrogenase